jgi:hypothetical protein
MGAFWILTGVVKQRSALSSFFGIVILLTGFAHVVVGGSREATTSSAGFRARAFCSG